MIEQLTRRLEETFEAISEGRGSEAANQHRLTRLLESLLVTAYCDPRSEQAVVSALERVVAELATQPGQAGLPEALDALLPAFASDPANADRFAELLRRVLPPYLRWAWGEETPVRRHFAAWQSSGFNLLPNHHYVPIPDLARLAQHPTQPSQLVGLDLAEEAQLALLREVFPRYRSEFEGFAQTLADAAPGQYYLENPAFKEVDAHALHALVRHHRPARIVEVGSGYSTLCTAAACLRNRAEGHPCEFVSVEPYPNDLFKDPIHGLDELVAKPLEEIGFGLFEALEANDVLFIDSTHVLSTGSDVARLYLEILPRLRPGVLVHIHDIFLPADYPRDWLTEEQIFWNEQYLLQAFLAFNSSFEVVFAAHFLHLRHPDLLAAAVPGYDPQRSAPGSFWIRRRE